MYALLKVCVDGRGRRPRTFIHGLRYAFIFKGGRCPMVSQRERRPKPDRAPGKV